MIDRYSVEKIIDAHRAEAIKAATEDRLASQMAAGRPKNRRVRSLVARLRATAFSGDRPLKAVARQREG